MKKGFEQSLVVFLFVLVLVIFSLAQRDSRKLDSLYRSAALLHKKQPSQLVQSPAHPHLSPKQLAD